MIKLSEITPPHEPFESFKSQVLSEFSLAKLDCLRHVNLGGRIELYDNRDLDSLREEIAQSSKNINFIFKCSTAKNYCIAVSCSLALVGLVAIASYRIIPMILKGSAFKKVLGIVFTLPVMRQTELLIMKIYEKHMMIEFTNRGVERSKSIAGEYQSTIKHFLATRCNKGNGSDLSSTSADQFIR